MTRNPDTKRSPPTQGVSGDGGRPIQSEPPSAVQVGRAVPIDHEGGTDADDEIDADDETDADGEIGADEEADAEGGTDSDDGPSPDGGFEWGPPLDDAEDKS